jgi:hypothetical protein
MLLSALEVGSCLHDNGLRSAVGSGIALETFACPKFAVALATSGTFELFKPYTGSLKLRNGASRQTPFNVVCTCGRSIEVYDKPIYQGHVLTEGHRRQWLFSNC